MSNKYPGGIITSGANAGYSVAFDGTGDYLTVANSTALDLSASNFTIECWCYFNAVPINTTRILEYRNGFASNSNFAYQFTLESGVVTAYVYSGTTSYAASGATVVVGRWYHLAMVRNGTTVTVYVNGVAGGTTATIPSTINNPASSVLYISSDLANSLNGYVSNFRVIKGTALYTAAFTPPTQLLAITNTSLLTCNSPAIVDQSSNNLTITTFGNTAPSTFTPFTGTQLVPNPNTLANTQGVWSISDAAYWMSQNKWPMPPNYPLQSLRFNSADTTFLNRTPASAGNRRISTLSFWVKRSVLSVLMYPFSAGADRLTFTANDQLEFTLGGGGGAIITTTQVFRDVSSWYHIVIALDTTQATASDRIKMYVNGLQITAFATATYPIQNYDPPAWNNASIHYVGRGGTTYFNGYMTDMNFIDGQALTPSSFGANDPNTGVWSPVPYSGTYGTNGFRLSFQDNTGTTATTLGKDYSGNGNNWTPNNFSVAAGSGNDSLTDGPTNWGIDYGNGGEVRGNYCTLNPLKNGGLTLANGNLDATATTSAWRSSTGTLAQSTGKFYYEITVTATTATNYMIAGVAKSSVAQSDMNDAPGVLNANSWGIQFGSPSWKVNNGYTALSSAYTYTTNDVLMIAVDVDAGKFWFGKNGTWIESGNPATGANAIFTNLTGEIMPMLGVYASGNTGSVNFGQRPFAYPAPSGFKVLCTTNLPIPTVGATSTTLANKYMDVSLYTGTGAVQSVTNSGSMQPDFVWLKNRNSTEWHSLFDAVRGALQNIRSNSTNAEVTATGTLTSFNSNGFSLGTDPSSYGVNTNTFTYVAWQWKANGAGVSNTAGSISSTVSANTTAGISVVTYTGNGASDLSSATIGHGLGVAPRMVITKNRSGAANTWNVYHASLGNTGAVQLQSTAATDVNQRYWNNTSPTSSVFSVSTNSTGYTNANGINYVAYAFAEVPGFSKFGSYTGNGSTDGPFVYCGFRPRFILAKRTDTTGDWVMTDAARAPYNVVTPRLFANVSDAESTATSPYDFLSNGFKLRNTNANENASGGTYIFMAFAEHPFQYARAR